MPALVLTDVWRTCNKLRAAIFRGGLNLWEYFTPLDPDRNCLISESKFVSVLTGPLRNELGLSDQEISQLADYFKVHDGRILYAQLCELIHGNMPDFSHNPPLVTGLEWEDPYHVNSLSVAEERRLKLLLTKIATLVNLRRLVLRPYFQDYELIAKNTGTVTLGYFARVLSYLGIMVSTDDFYLLVKKFIKDSYTINYVAFVAALNIVVQCLDQQAMLDIGGDVLENFPGRALCAELPKLPRPEVGNVRTDIVFGTPNVFHPVLDRPKEPLGMHDVLRRIQRYVLTNRVRTDQFFQNFDLLGCGRVTLAQFRRCLDMLGISGIQRLYLSEPEIDQLIHFYSDPDDPHRVCYLTFADDIDQVFTTKELEKFPELVLSVPPENVVELPREGTRDWHSVSSAVRETCEDVIEKIKKRIRSRRMQLRPVFTNYDRHNAGHVTRSQFRQALLSLGILMSVHELDALEARFLDDMGFNYFWFLREVESGTYEEPLYDGFIQEMKKLNTREHKERPANKERDIVEILAKIKGKVVRERIRVMEFLRDFDCHNEQNISRENFCRGVSVCRFELTPTEMETLMDVFASPMRRHRVDYVRFSEAVEEALTQSCLERAPLIIPLQHIPSRDNDRNFLNFEERHQFSMAMDKLAEKPNMNLESIFQDYDRTNIGSVPRHQFSQALSTRGMETLVSSRELEMVHKCFGVWRGMRDEVDYRAFCNALRILQVNARRKAF